MHKNTAVLLTFLLSAAACGEDSVREQGIFGDPIEFNTHAVGPLAPTFAEWNVPHPRLWFPNTEAEQDVIWTAMTTNPQTSTVTNSFATSFGINSDFGAQNWRGARELRKLSEVVTRCVLQYDTSDLTNIPSQCTDALADVMAAINHPSYQIGSLGISGWAFEWAPDIGVLIGLVDAVYSFADPSNEQPAMRNFAKNWYNHMEGMSLSTGSVANNCWFSNEYCRPLKTAQLSILVFLLGKNVALSGTQPSQFDEKLSLYLEMMIRALKSNVAVNGNLTETSWYDHFSSRFYPWFAMRPYILRGYNYVDQTNLPTAGRAMAILSLFKKPFQNGDQGYGDLYGVPLMYLGMLRYHPNPVEASKLRHHLWERVTEYGGLQRHSNAGQGESIRGWFGRAPLMDIAMDVTTMIPFEAHEYSSLSVYAEPDPNIDPKQTPYLGDIGDGRYVSAFLVNDLTDGPNGHSPDTMRFFVDSGYFGNHKHESSGGLMGQIAGQHAWTGPESATTSNPQPADNTRRNLLLVDPAGGQNYAHHGSENNNYFSLWNQSFTTQLDRAQLGMIDAVKINDLHYVASPFSAGDMDAERTVVMAKNNHPGGVAYVLDFLKGAFHASGATVASAKNMAGTVTHRTVTGGKQWYRHTRSGVTSYSGFIDTDINDVNCNQSNSDCHFGFTESDPYNAYVQHVYQQTQTTGGDWLTFLQYHGASEPDLVENFSDTSNFPSASNVVGGVLHFTSGGRHVADVLMFKRNDGTMAASGVVTDADFVFARYDTSNGDLLELQVLGARSFEHNGQEIFHASEKIDVYASETKWLIGSGNETLGFPSGVPAISLANLFFDPTNPTLPTVYIDRKQVNLGQYGLTITPAAIEFMGGFNPLTSPTFLSEDGYTVSDTFFPFFDRGGLPHPDGTNIVTTANHTAVVAPGSVAGSLPLLGEGPNGIIPSSVAVQIAMRSTSSASQTTTIRIGTTPGDKDVASIHVRRSPSNSNKLRVQFRSDDVFIQSLDIETNANGYGALDLLYERITGTAVLFNSFGDVLALANAPLTSSGVFAEMSLYPGGEVDFVAMATDVFGDAIPRNHAMHVDPDGFVELYIYSFFGGTSPAINWRLMNTQMVTTAQATAAFAGALQLNLVSYAPTLPPNLLATKTILVRSDNPVGPTTHGLLAQMYSRTRITGVEMGTRIVVHP